MPTPLMKSFAQQTGKKTKTVEKLWKKCEKIVKKEYGVDEKSSRFYPLVVGCLKNLLDIKKFEEDGEMTTANIGDYVFANKLGTQSRQPIISDPMKVQTKITKKKNYKKVFEVLSTHENFDSVLSDMINFYSEKIEESEEIIDKSIEMTAKYLNISIEKIEIDKE